MNYLKTYEDYSELTDYTKTIMDEIEKTNWKNIFEEDGNMYVNLFELGVEMLESIDTSDKYLVEQLETYYRDFLKDLIENAVITFYSEEEGKDITGICEEVIFDVDNFSDLPDDTFQIDGISFKINGISEPLYVSDEKIKITNIDPKVFISSKKYNL